MKLPLRPRFLPFLPLLCCLHVLPLAAVRAQPGPPATDPFLKSSAPPGAATATAPATPDLPKEGLVRVEVFSLSTEEGFAATRRFPQQAALYEWLGEELEKAKPVVKLERLMVVRVRSGQRGKVEEVEEFAFPTEFSPPRLPQSISLGLPAANPAPPVTPAPAAAPAPAPAAAQPTASGRSLPAGGIRSAWFYSPTIPQSFEFRNTGWTLETELTIADDRQHVDLNLAFNFCRLAGLESQSRSGEVMQPAFETSKVATQVLTKFGQPTLVGTFNPPVDSGAEGGNTLPVTRLLFLTVTTTR